MTQLFEFAKRSPSAAKRLKGAAKQTAFGTANAMNDVSFELRRKVFWPQVRASFKLRNNFLTKGLSPGRQGPGGIGVEKATKRDLRTRVFYGTGLEFLTKHQEGGVKLPGSDRDAILVPDPRGPFGGNKIKRIKPTLRKVDKPGSRIFTVGKGTPRARIVERGKGKLRGTRRLRSKKTGRLKKAKKVKNRRTRTLWWLESRARIDKALRVRETAERVGRAMFPKRLDAQIRRAFATARR